MEEMERSEIEKMRREGGWRYGGKIRIERGYEGKGEMRRRMEEMERREEEKRRRTGDKYCRGKE
jgi:hypothetical protein